MKKLFMMALSIMLMSTTASADDWEINEQQNDTVQVEFETDIIDNYPAQPEVRHIPLRLPKAYYCNGTLIFKNVHPEYQMNVVKDDEIVYSTTILSTMMEVPIFTLANGECELQLIIGRFCFTGHINL